MPTQATITSTNTATKFANVHTNTTNSKTQLYYYMRIKQLRNLSAIMGRYNVQDRVNSTENTTQTYALCRRCRVQIPSDSSNNFRWIGGLFVNLERNEFCKYCNNHNTEEISLYMHSILDVEGVLTCLIVPQSRTIASLLIRTATQPRGELESVLDVLTNRIPNNLRVRTIHTSSHYTVFCYKNLSRIVHNERYMNQDHILELQQIIGTTNITTNRDRDMKQLLESHAYNISHNLHINYSNWYICKFT